MNMNFFETYIKEEIATGIVLVLVIFSRVVIAKIVRRFARVTEILEHRANLVIKYFNILISIVAIIALFVIWGVKPQNVIVVISSLFAVVGVAMFATWSILSNVTSGIILFFSAPFKIGDIIKIHDKEFPIEAEVDDIRGFHTYLKTKEGELITYPNSLLLQKGISVIKKPSEEKEFFD